MTYSSETAFHALDLPDADDLVLRADLLRRISELVKERRLGEAQAAELMGLDPAMNRGAKVDLADRTRMLPWGRCGE